jgi:hypothetical protein
MKKRHPKNPNRTRKRATIPKDTKRKLLLECGLKCSIACCAATQALEFHHINGDRCDNHEENILVLCAVHHSLAHDQRSPLDRKTCRMLRQAIWLRH